MVKIEKETLPKEYERAIIGEYYKMYKEREGFPIPTSNDIRFTADLHRLRKKDLRNPELMKAIEAYTSIEDDNVEGICYGPNDVITAIARIIISEDNLHIIDIIYLYYPSLAEKYSYIKNILDIANCYGYSKGCNTISCAVNKNDSITFDILTNLGYELTPEMEKEASNYPTYILERKTIRKNGPTRCR